MEIAVLGIDLGKNSCSTVGLDDAGAVVLRRRMRREGVIKLAGKLRPCVVAMEACCGAHHLGRVLRAQGHEVRLMSPEYVRPYVKSQKNDDRDAEAIAEAATRPTMRFVALKSEEQLDMQTLHRARDRLVGERTALINQLRAVLLGLPGEPPAKMEIRASRSGVDAPFFKPGFQDTGRLSGHLAFHHPQTSKADQRIAMRSRPIRIMSSPTLATNRARFTLKIGSRYKRKHRD